MSNKCRYKKDNEREGCYRIVDRHGNFLGEIENGILSIFCKCCKELHPVLEIPKEVTPIFTGSSEE